MDVYIHAGGENLCCII